MTTVYVFMFFFLVFGVSSSTEPVSKKKLKIPFDREAIRAMLPKESFEPRMILDWIRKGQEGHTPNPRPERKSHFVPFVKLVIVVVIISVVACLAWAALFDKKYKKRDEGIPLSSKKKMMKDGDPIQRGFERL